MIRDSFVSIFFELMSSMGSKYYEYDTFFFLENHYEYGTSTNNLIPPSSWKDWKRIWTEDLGSKFPQK